MGAPVGAVIRTVAGFVLEAFGVVLIAVALGFLFGWAWALVPIGVYVTVTGVTLGSGGMRR